MKFDHEKEGYDCSGRLMRFESSPRSNTAAVFAYMG
jgi:hypothetical protein